LAIKFFKLKKNNLHDFYYGFKQGIPIALGYIPVSFTFGLMAVSGGIPVWMAIFISLSNLTSAGQFAGTKLIIADAPLLEIALTTFVINIRYMLMSLSLSQRITPEMPIVKRCIMAFGITDETFTVASLEKREITFAYMMGLITCPYWGWGLGTALGALTSSILPQRLQSSMGIALYAMFIALIVPAAKKSKAALAVSAIAISISSFFAWMPYMAKVSEGWSIIIATIVASCAGALLFPVEEDEYE
jgi:4-azaleucine resistance transporter AzlC